MMYWCMLQHGWTLKTLHLSERSQSQKMMYCMIPEFIKKKEMSGVGKSRQKVYWWLLRANWSDCGYVWASFGKDESVLGSDSVRVAQICEYTSKHWIIHFRRLNYPSAFFFFNRNRKIHPNVNMESQGTPSSQNHLEKEE